MISISEAQELIEKFIELRDKAQKSELLGDQKILKQHEELCVKKFQYIITMRTSRYKAFSNYDDLNQEGNLALVSAMKNYNPARGNFFWWCHRYVDTRISRSANLHTTIRFPLKIAKANAPHKEAALPLLIEDRYCPDKELEASQTLQAINNVLVVLTPDQKNIINLVYGLDGDKPLSINKICKKLNVSRSSCIKTIKTAISLMKDNIRI